jgi:hypothetical protein
MLAALGISDSRLDTVFACACTMEQEGRTKGLATAYVSATYDVQQLSSVGCSDNFQLVFYVNISRDDWNRTRGLSSTKLVVAMRVS